MTLIIQWQMRTNPWTCTMHQSCLFVLFLLGGQTCQIMQVYHMQYMGPKFTQENTHEP